MHDVSTLAKHVPRSPDSVSSFCRQCKPAVEVPDAITCVQSIRDSGGWQAGGELPNVAEDLIPRLGTELSLEEQRVWEPFTEEYPDEMLVLRAQFAGVHLPVPVNEARYNFEMAQIIYPSELDYARVLG